MLASATLVDKKVPINNRVVFVTPQYYTYLKLDKRFTSYGDKAQEIATSGAVGLVDNTEVVVAPTDYFPEGVNYIIIFTKLHFFHHSNYQNTYSTKTRQDFRVGSVKEEFILMLSF